MGYRRIITKTLILLTWSNCDNFPFWSKLKRILVIKTFEEIIILLLFLQKVQYIFLLFADLFYPKFFKNALFFCNNCYNSHPYFSSAFWKANNILVRYRILSSFEPDSSTEATLLHLVLFGHRFFPLTSLFHIIQETFLATCLSKFSCLAPFMPQFSKIRTRNNYLVWACSPDNCSYL